jgi:hypothetical protein
MRVVANGIVLNKIKTLDIFKLDLGNSMIDQKTNELSIKDTFVYKYYTLFGKQILKYGNIGKLSFYQDFNLSGREYIIFNDEKMYNVIYDKDEEKLEIDEHLSKIIQEIEMVEGLHLSDDDSTDGKKNVPDISLPKDQYIQEMIKKRK